VQAARWLPLAVAWLFGVAASSGPPPPPRVDATLDVRLAAGKSTYATGELIPLALEFRGHADPDYYFSTVSGDRLGSMGHERYAVTPADAVDDPLSDYFASVGVVGSVLSGWHPLDRTPLVVRSHLNEWVRFKRPGDYRLVVTSTRLERYSRRPAPPVVSEPVVLRIEAATPQWADAEAARAVSSLEGAGPESSREAISILRHLGTRQAALALVSHYGAGGDRSRLDVTAGLVASPWRAEVVRAMEARVDAGEGLPAGFLRDLALLRSMLEGGPGSARFVRQRALECEGTRRWMGALASRGPSAERLGTALSVLADSPDLACDTGLGTLLAGHPAAGQEAFLALPATTQGTLLEYRWEAVRGPWIQPGLERLYDRWGGDCRFAGAGDLALRRLLEMDPAKGRSLLLAEIRTGAHGLAPDTLLSLADGPLSGLDEPLRERLEAADSPERRAASMWLIARFGSAALAPLVRAELDRDAACAVEAAGIAYLLRYDPPAALRRLEPGFDRARPGTCVVPPWSELARRVWDERVEDAALAHLRGAEGRLVFDAVQVLGTHGSARVSGPLVERFARWSAQWRGREDELEELAAHGPSVDSPAVLENALVNALFDNPRILLTPAGVERIRGLCVTTACQEEVDARARRPR
jgi:hypothetical protein